MTGFMETHRTEFRWGLLVSFALFIMVATGCGVEKAPLSADGEGAEMAVAPQGQSFIVFNPLVAEAAGKKIKNQGKKIKDKFNHKGGELVIEEEWEEDDEDRERGDRERDDDDDRERGDKERDDDDDRERGDKDKKKGEAKKRVDFQVGKNAIARGEDVEIEMELWGDYASEMVVGFTPSGYEFQEDCVLEIEIKGDWVDLTEEQIQALHISDSGQIESAQILKIKVDDDELKIRIRIPGFSRYSMGGGA